MDSLKELKKCVENMEAHINALSKEAAKAKVLIEGEGETSPIDQRGAEIGADAVAGRNARLFKKNTLRKVN